jgi:hypothetical protein
MKGVRAEWAISADFSRFNGDPEEFKEVLRKEIEENPDENKRKELEKQILKVTGHRFQDVSYLYNFRENLSQEMMIGIKIEMHTLIQSDENILFCYDSYR